jgi:hypothetical protein
MSDFVPGLALARTFYQEVLAGIIGGIPHAAALLGEGSEVLGFDTERSTDHAWGPRAQIFVEAEAADQLRIRIDAGLPDTFRGWPVRYYRWQTRRIEHHVEVISLQAWLRKQFGMDPRPAMATDAWLATPQQLLLEAISGLVFHDDSGELTRIRGMLRWYPDDVWLWMMAAQWGRLGDEESFIGRTAELGDELGSRLLAGDMTRQVVRLCFLQERQYAPYAKWTGTAFSRLKAATDVGPALHDVCAAEGFARREQALIHLSALMAGRHNALGVTGALSTTTGSFEVGINDAVRPYRVLNAGRFAKACLDAITDEALRRMPAVGAIDQLTNPTDLLIHFTDWPQQMRGVYQRHLALEPPVLDDSTPPS